MIKKFIMKIRRVADYSYSVTLPKEAVKQMGWRERQKVVIEFDEKKKEFRIKDWKKK